VVDSALGTCELPRPVVHRVLDHPPTDDTMQTKSVATPAPTRPAGRATARRRRIPRRGAPAAPLDRGTDRSRDATTLDAPFAA
jgi:hypothetical protein